MLFIYSEGDPGIEELDLIFKETWRAHVP